MSMRHFLPAGLLCLALTAQTHAQHPWAVASPDGQTTSTSDRQGDGRLTYRVARGGQPVLADSPLGIRRADQIFDGGLTFVSASPVRAIDERYTMPHGKRKDHHVLGRERTFTFANPTGGKLEVIVRAHDDGVAFRYRFPETAQGLRTVVEEQ